MTTPTILVAFPLEEDEIIVAHEGTTLRSSFRVCRLCGNLVLASMTPTHIREAHTQDDEKRMWEILVPTVSNEGKPYRTRYHRVWDAKVKKITGGLTIVHPVKGTWVDPTDEAEYHERMIPVRIMATRGQIAEIAAMTKKYYDQLEVLAYEIGPVYYTGDEA